MSLNFFDAATLHLNLQKSFWEVADFFIKENGSQGTAADYCFTLSLSDARWMAD